MRNQVSRACLTAAVLALATACASAPPGSPPPPGASQSPSSQEPRMVQPARARYLPYAGAPIDHFNWMGYIDGWEALSDSELVVFVGANGAYLLTVWSPCGTRGLPWVNHIGLTRSIAGSVYARLDAVRVEHVSCPISEIRPIDYKRMKQEAREKRAAQQTAATGQATAPAAPPAATAPAAPPATPPQ